MPSSLAVRLDPRLPVVGAGLATAAAVGADTPADLTAVLYDVVRLAREALDADRTGVLLLDANGRLVPVAAAGRVSDPVAHARFLAMPPVPLELLPRGVDLLRAGQPVLVPDVVSSPYVPTAFAAEFGITTLAIAPLTVGGSTAGVLVVVPRSGSTFGGADLRSLGGLARSAACALRGARAYADAVTLRRGLDQMLEVTAALNAATTLQRVVEVAVDGLADLLGGVSASVSLFDGGSAVRTLATRGAGQPEIGTHPLPAQYVERREECLALWRTDPTSPVVLDAGEARALLPEGVDPDGVPSYVALPVALTGVPAGVALVGRLERGPVDAQLLVLARTVVGHVSLAVERARLHDDVARRLARLEMIYRLADEVSLRPDMRAVIDRIAPDVRAVTGGELIDAYLCDAQAAKLFSTGTPNGTFATVLRMWRRRRSHRVAECGGLLVVPMLLDQALVGVLRVRPVRKQRFDRDDEEFLLAVGSGVASVVTRTVLRSCIAESHRQLAIAEERERMARDLHDTLGQALFGIALKLEECAETTADPQTREHLVRLRGAVASANVEVRQVIHALSFVDCTGDGLVPSLRDLARRSNRPDGPTVEFRTRGPAVTLPAAREEALYRVVHEALANVRKHSNATRVVVSAAYGDRVEVVVHDDGDGLPPRAQDKPGLHFGLRTMLRRMEEVGGGLSIENAPPRGVRVTAWVPTT